jgi:NAD(P)-dependent dehydrogenase (short-subunit alcohol dehydrogenase family)
MSRLQGRTAVISGAASGIGLATARLFVRQGASVVLLDRDQPRLAEAIESLPGEGHEAVVLDVTHEAEWAALAERLETTRGRLDVLVNNAGFGSFRSIADTSLEQWRAIIAVNLDSVFLATKHLLPLLAAQGPRRRADAAHPADGSHLTQREDGDRPQSGLSPLGPARLNTMAPDEGNMYLLGKVGSAEQKARFLAAGRRAKARSAFFMTEPAAEGGAGSDPSMMQTTCRLDGNHWVINGRKAFITGAEGAKVGIVMAKSDRRRLHVPGRSARSGDPHRARARHDRQLDARRPCDRHDRQPARAGRPDAGRERRGLQICADPPERRRGCRTACAGSALRSARTRSPPTMPAGARPSASR